MVKREQLIIAVIAAAVIGFFIGRLTGPDSGCQAGSPAGDAPLALTDSTKIPAAGAPAMGSETPKVIIVEFSDFQCPFCSRGAATIKQVVNSSKDTRLVFRHNPLSFHKQAFLAAEASLAANAQGKFWEMHDKLFANQKSLGREDLDRYAEQIGLDMRKFKADLDNHVHKAAIEADMKLAASLGARGTPAFFVNGQLISGAQPAEKFQAAIDAELAEVDRLLAAGSKREEVYAQRVEANFKAPAPKREAAADAANAVYKVPLGSSYAKGATDALVTIINFSEFECPFSGRVNPTLDKLIESYPGKVKVAFKHTPLPFHKNATLASEAALAAGAQGKFWPMYDKLFANQKALGREDLERYAGEIGLDLARFKADLDGHTFQKVIDEDKALANKIGAQGTPNLFINGRKLVGAQPYESFQQIVDEEIKKAQALVDAGTPVAAVYDKLTEKGLEKARPAAKPDRPQAKRRQEDPQAVYNVPLPVGETYAKGPADALVTIMEFSEFQCPYCSRAAKTVDEIAKAYPKEVRVIFRHNPLGFHKNAPGAALASLAAAEQGKFWEMHDVLFANQKALEADKLEGYAAQAGLNIAKFQQAMQQERGKERIAADQQLANSLGARGTPAFFINGRKLSGAQPFEAFKALIDEELVKARALVAQGTPPAKLYGKITSGGATAAVFLPDAAGEDGDAPARPALRKVVDIGAAPVKGNEKAKVEIVVFSEFECPFCSRGEAAVEQVLKAHGDRVKFAFKHFPLSFHKNAFSAAEASLAAAEQGKFWEMHDRLFANQKALSPDDLTRYAREIGLNMDRYKAAMDSRKFKAAVEADMAQGRALGVDGTPSFYVNGRAVDGGYDALQAAVEAELKRPATMLKLDGGRPGPKAPLLQKLNLRKLDGPPGKPGVPRVPKGGGN